MVIQFLKSKAFQRYTLSYLIVFFIPLIVMSVLIYYQSIAALKQEIEKTNTNKLMQVSQMTDGRIKEMWDIAARITYDAHLTPYMVSHPFTQKDAIEKLRIYKSSTAIIDQIFLYYNGSPDIYSDQGYYSTDTLMDRVLNLKEQAQDQFMDVLQKSEAPAVYPMSHFLSGDSSSHDIIAFFNPIPPNDSIHYGSVLYFVKKSVYYNMIKNTLGDFKGNVYIFNRNKELITSDSSGGTRDNKLLEELALTSRPGIHKATVHGKNYSIVTVRSNTSGWTFVTTMPTAQFFSRVFHIQIFLLAILVSLILTGLALALVLATKQYKPINSLMDYAQNHKNRLAMGRPSSINETIEGFIKNHDLLRSRVSAQEPFVRDQCLMKILRGGWDDPETIRQVCASTGISFPYPYYFVVYISFDDGPLKDVKTKGALMDMLDKADFQGAVGYGVELIHDNAIAVIFNSGENQAPAAETTIKSLRHQIRVAGSVATIGVGTFYTDITQIHLSFVEASGAVEYRLANGTDSIIYFKPFTNIEKPNDWYANDIQIKLAQSLKKGNERAAAETVHTMLGQIKTQQASIDLLKCYCFDMINVIFRTATGVKYTDPDAMKDIVNFTSVEELEPKLTRYIHGLCRKVEDNKEQASLLLHEQILAYIYEHFKEYELGLEKIAAHFNLSESYLSRFIKEKSGLTFMQYLWKLRIDEVKRQLKETDTAIRDIIQDVGYIDVPNFSRKFKKSEGMTPGQYRKQST